MVVEGVLEDAEEKGERGPETRCEGTRALTGVLGLAGDEAVAVGDVVEDKAEEVEDT